MKTEAVVKKAGNTAAEVGIGAAGFAGGLLLGNAIPNIGFGPDAVKTHMQKMVPGLSVIILSALAGLKLAKGNSKIEAAAFGGGVAGALLILKNYLPDDVFKKYFTKGLSGVGAPPVLDLAQDNTGAYRMLNGMGEPQNTYQLLN